MVRERTYEGEHGSRVLIGLMVGIVLFILSEVFFFFSFFWAFFHRSLRPAVELGCVWPPSGLEVFSPFSVPLLNTVILLRSGVRVTWAHQRFLNGFWKGVVISLFVTWVLGGYFLGLQGFEYYMASYDIRRSVFGSVFFVATGFHGFHVIVGTTFLVIIWVRGVRGHFSEKHHFGFEAAA